MQPRPQVQQFQAQVYLPPPYGYYQQSAPPGGNFSAQQQLLGSTVPAGQQVGFGPSAPQQQPNSFAPGVNPKPKKSKKEEAGAAGSVFFGPRPTSPRLWR
jgi:hypothetical protein